MSKKGPGQVGDLDGLGAQEVLVQAIALRARALDDLVRNVLLPRQIPAGAAAGHEAEIGGAIELAPEPGQALPRGAEVPLLGVDEDAVVIPEQVPSRLHSSVPPGWVRWPLPQVRTGRR